MAFRQTISKNFERFDRQLPRLLSTHGALDRWQFYFLAAGLVLSVFAWADRDLPWAISVLLLSLVGCLLIVLVGKRLRHAGLPVSLVLLVGLPVVGWVALGALTAYPGKRSARRLGWPSAIAVLAVVGVVASGAQLLPLASSVGEVRAPQMALDTTGQNSGESSVDGTSGGQEGKRLPSVTAGQEDASFSAGEPTGRFEANPDEVDDVSVMRGSNLMVQIGQLTEAPEVADGYDRSLFRHWTDADGDGCNTREEVLIAESLTTVELGPSCSISNGRWSSLFDGTITEDPSDFDVDHFVPLKEAWASGAHSWDSERRERFANDLGYTGSLIAVSSSSNRSKGSNDPSGWLPNTEGYVCGYIATWVEVKLLWELSADPAELAALRDVASGC